MMQIDWRNIKLAIFDVDGTLYRQRPVRMAMAAALVMSGIGKLSMRDARLLSRYRRSREENVVSEDGHFHDVLVAGVAKASGVTPDHVQSVVDEWLHHRPLRHVGKAPHPGIAELFDELKSLGVSIGVLSDYPAAGKLGALNLRADYIVHAEERDVGRLKPHPAGLHKLLKLADVQPHEAVYFGDRADRDGVLGISEGVPTVLIGDTLAGCRTIAAYGEISEELRHLHQS